VRAARFAARPAAPKRSRSVRHALLLQRRRRATYSGHGEKQSTPCLIMLRVRAFPSGVTEHRLRNRFLQSWLIRINTLGRVTERSERRSGPSQPASATTELRQRTSAPHWGGIERSVDRPIYRLVPPQRVTSAPRSAYA